MSPATRLTLLTAVPVAAALYLGVIFGVFAQGVSLGLTALIIGIPVAAAIGILAGRAVLHSAIAITQGTGSRLIAGRIEPLRVRTDRTEPGRIEILHSGIESDSGIDDSIATIHLARRLTARGHRVRIITTDVNGKQRDWQRRLEAQPGLEGFSPVLELFDATDRDHVLSLNPADSVIATGWDTAHVADSLLASLDRDFFLYLIRSFEPLRHPMGSTAALAEQSYDFKHTAVFSSGLLLDYFAEQRLGVFTPGPRLGRRDATAYRPPVNMAGPVEVEGLKAHERRSLLFLARPEGDAARNLFDLGILAIDRAAAAGHFRNWDLVGLGSDGPGETRILLPVSKAEVRIIPRPEPDEYVETLRRFDVGLSLMFSPHPGLTAIEMASAGLVTVTNLFANRDESMLAGISANLIGAEPQPEALALALAEAEMRSADLESRAAGSLVDWPSGWDQALDDEVMDSIERLLG